jgi:hypothetical protein
LSFPWRILPLPFFAFLPLLRLPDLDLYLQGSRHTAGAISFATAVFLVRLQRPAIVAIVAIVAEQEDDLRMDAVDCEAGWDSIELIAAGLSGIVSCYKS